MSATVSEMSKKRVSIRAFPDKPVPDETLKTIFTMEKYLNIMGAVDMGIYAQMPTLMMMENGISSCLRGALGQFPDPVRKFLDIPQERGILFGMSFGYPNEDEPVNAIRTAREPVKNSVIFRK